MRVLAILFLMCYSSSFAQKYTFQTTSYAYKIKEKEGWGTPGENWSSKIETKLNIVFDLDNGKVFVDSSNPQAYSLTNFLSDGVNKRGEKFVTFLALDKNLKPCKIMFVFSKNDSSSHQIYFIYNDFKFYYNFFSLSNFFED
ncbi:hypothetical protein JSO59_007235 [Riemerella anatipestifer]|uniref:hypothetical protein n=1 Tax=Riemerella anatipestifer TaxID=34085 RepID=UPI0030BDCADF